MKSKPWQKQCQGFREKQSLFSASPTSLCCSFSRASMLVPFCLGHSCYSILISLYTAPFLLREIFPNHCVTSSPSHHVPLCTSSFFSIPHPIWLTLLPISSTKMQVGWEQRLCFVHCSMTNGYSRTCPDIGTQYRSMKWKRCMSTWNCVLLMGLPSRAEKGQILAMPTLRNVMGRNNRQRK